MDLDAANLGGFADFVGGGKGGDAKGGVVVWKGVLGPGGGGGVGVVGVGRVAGLFFVMAGVVVLLGLAPVVVFVVGVRRSSRGRSASSLSSALGGMARHVRFFSIICTSFPAMRWRGRVRVISRVCLTGGKVEHFVAVRGQTRVAVVFGVRPSS